jgi:MYXO-CTERM domain-containing protein
VTARDHSQATISGTTSILVGPGPLATCAITGLPTVAGQAATATVTASDAYGNVETGLAGTWHVTSDDPQAVIPATVGFTAGLATVPVTLGTAGTHGLTVTTGTPAVSCTGTTTVAPGPTRAYLVTLPGHATVGAAVDVTAVAQDQFGNPTSTYAGTGHVTSSDTGAVLPADLVFSAGGAAGKVTLHGVGSQTVTLTDLADGTISGTATTTVQAAPKPKTGCGCGNAPQGDLAGLLALGVLAWRRRREPTRSP